METGATRSELRIPEDLRERLIAHARAVAPKEACGILGGNDGQAKAVFEVPNVDESQTTYLMEPRQQFRVMRQLRAMGLEMVAIYHSHPATEAYPSATDRKLAYYPDCFYVIVSLAEPDRPVIKAFRIADDKVTEGEITA